MNEKRKRIRRVIVTLAVAGIILLAYAAFYAGTGLAVPCVFRELTGLRCPGCGISTFSVLLLKRQWKAALAQNYMAPWIYLYLLWVVWDFCRRYIKSGETTLMPQPELLNVSFLVLVVAWWCLRNIIGI